MDWPKLPPSPYLTFRASDDVRIADTRVNLQLLIEAFANGTSPEQFKLSYPTVSLEDVYGAIAYYLGNQEAVDRYVALCELRDRAFEAEIDSQPEPAIVKRLKALISAGRPA